MFRFAAAVAMATFVASPCAFAQQPPPLAYVQPIAPPGLRAVQDALNRAGIYAGAVDGAWGQDSQAALQQFQQGHGLQVTGQMNPATAQALGLDPARLLQSGSGRRQSATSRAACSNSAIIRAAWTATGGLAPRRRLPDCSRSVASSRPASSTRRRSARWG
jgi:hypothetical protein